MPSGGYYNKEKSGSNSLCQLCHCIIRDNTIFCGLTDRQLEHFKRCVRTYSYKKKEVVFFEGDPCGGFYVMKSGRIKLLRTSNEGKELILKIAKAGELIGMEAFYEGKMHANTAIAMNDSELCFMKRRDFFSVLKQEPLIAKKVIVALSRELSEAYDKIGLMGLMNARAKMAHLLSSLASEYGIYEGGKLMLNLTLSRMEIAELLGITQETSIRLLKSFREEGLIQIKKKKVIINSINKLRKEGSLN